jgi:hypothetical protein
VGHEAATIILNGVKADQWRILVGPDAHKSRVPSALWSLGRSRDLRFRTEVRSTLRWRGLDSNFQYAGAVNLIVAPRCGSSVPPARCDKSRRRRIPRVSAFQPRPSLADKRLHRSSQCWFSIAITACAAKFCNSAICLSEARVPPHPGAHRAAKFAPLGGGAQPPGGRRRAFCPPGPGDGLRRSSSPLAWGKYERVVRVSRQRRDEIKSYALVPR